MKQNERVTQLTQGILNLQSQLSLWRTKWGEEETKLKKKMAELELKLKEKEETNSLLKSPVSQLHEEAKHIFKEEVSRNIEQQLALLSQGKSQEISQSLDRLQLKISHVVGLVGRLSNMSRDEIRNLQQENFDLKIWNDELRSECEEISQAFLDLKEQNQSLVDVHESLDTDKHKVMDMLGGKILSLMEDLAKTQSSHNLKLDLQERKLEDLMEKVRQFFRDLEERRKGVISQHNLEVSQLESQKNVELQEKINLLQLELVGYHEANLKIKQDLNAKVQRGEEMLGRLFHQKSEEISQAIESLSVKVNSLFEKLSKASQDTTSTLSHLEHQVEGRDKLLDEEARNRKELMTKISETVRFVRDNMAASFTAFQKQ
jgi:chromosome segregation ATPase